MWQSLIQCPRLIGQFWIIFLPLKLRWGEQVDNQRDWEWGWVVPQRISGVPEERGISSEQAQQNKKPKGVRYRVGGRRQQHYPSCPRCSFTIGPQVSRLLLPGYISFSFVQAKLLIMHLTCKFSRVLAHRRFYLLITFRLQDQQEEFGPVSGEYM